MEITRTVRPDGKAADLRVWHCSGCDRVHLSVMDMTLDFSRDEFAAFTEAVVDVGLTGWISNGSIIDLVDQAAASTVH